MRKFFILLFFAFLAISSWGQTREDQKIILQKCIDLPDLQNFYKGDQLFVVANENQFNEVLDVSWNNKPVVFVKMAKIEEQGISSFFLINTFQVSGSEGIVAGKYVFNYSGNINRLVELKLKFQKNGQIWSVINSEIKQF